MTDKERIKILMEKVERQRNGLIEADKDPAGYISVNEAIQLLIEKREKIRNYANKIYKKDIYKAHIALAQVNAIDEILDYLNTDKAYYDYESNKK